MQNESGHIRKPRPRAHSVTESRPHHVARAEVFSVSGEQIVPKLKELLRQGNTHRIMVIDGQGNVLVDIPTFLGVAGTMLFPAAAALAVAGAVAANLRIIVERTS